MTLVRASKLLRMINKRSLQCSDRMLLKHLRLMNGLDVVCISKKGYT